jgi:hypothetical protein
MWQNILDVKKKINRVGAKTVMLLLTQALFEQRHG